MLTIKDVNAVLLKFFRWSSIPFLVVYILVTALPVLIVMVVLSVFAVVGVVLSSPLYVIAWYNQRKRQSRTFCMKEQEKMLEVFKQFCDSLEYVNVPVKQLNPLLATLPPVDPKLFAYTLQMGEMADKVELHLDREPYGRYYLKIPLPQFQTNLVIYQKWQPDAAGDAPLCAVGPKGLRDIAHEFALVRRELEDVIAAWKDDCEVEDDDAVGNIYYIILMNLIAGKEALSGV